MLNLAAQPQKNRTAPEQWKLYRGYLGITQAQLAAKLGTTLTSVARWETGHTPISLMTMGYLRALVTAQVGEQTRLLFTELVPKLTLSEFDGLFGNPDAGFVEDVEGNLYLGSVYIEGYRRHSLHLRLSDRKWCALDRDGHPTVVDEQFLQTVISAGKEVSS
jgi:transcriptional regulator with XRE-family HTH domain